MSPIKWLDNTLYADTILGVHRKYCIQSKIKKILIILQTAVHGIIVFGEQYYLFHREDCNQQTIIYGGFLIAAYFAYTNTVVSALSYSSDFIVYFKNISRVSEKFIYDDNFIISLKQLYRFSVTFISLSIAFAVYRSTILILIDISEVHDGPITFQNMLIFFSQTIIRVTIFVQKLNFFIVIMLVVYVMKRLNLMVSAAEKTVICDNLGEVCNITREQIQEWVRMYLDLANCCEKITLCFGRPFFVWLLVSVLYYIIMTYEMCYLSLVNIADLSMALILLSYTSLLVLPIIEGQLLHNQGHNFQRKLAKLYNTIIIIELREREAKSVKDFIRVMKKSPLEVNLLSKLSAGMFMIPVLVAFTVQHIIILLQFTNIV